MKQIAAVELARFSDRSLMHFIGCGNNCGEEDCDHVKEDPKTRLALEITRLAFRRVSSPIVGLRHGSRDSLPEFRCCHSPSADLMSSTAWGKGFAGCHFN